VTPGGMSWYRIKNRLIARFITRFPSLSEGFIRSYAPWESEDTPWEPLTKPLSQCTVALVTTAGVHHRDQKPFDMHDKDGDPSFRLIDLARPSDSLMITHDYYDHRDADRDLNIVFPAERLREFAAEGLIGRLAHHAYGLMGHITGRHGATLINRTAPEITAIMKQDRVDAVLLTPG
jgi:D-proline reductase (dithiol) PrdB